MARLLLLLACLAGCDARTRVEITLDIDDTVALGELGTLLVHVAGDQAPVDRTVAFPEGFAERQARLLYYPKVERGRLQFDLAALRRGDGVTLASAAGGVELVPGGAVALSLPLGAGGGRPDLATIDLAGADLSLLPNDLAGADLVLPSNALFEDTFETYTSIADLTGGGKWSVANPGALSIDSQGARGSTRSFRLFHDGGTGQFNAGVGSVGVVPPSPMWLRVFIKREGSLPSSGMQLMHVSRSGGGPGVDIDLLPDGSFGIGTYGGATGASLQSATLVPTVFKCLEWFIDRSSHTMQVFLDGTELTDLRVTDLSVSMTWDQVGLFVDTNFPTPTGPVYLVYDELAFGPNRINCN